MSNNKSVPPPLQTPPLGAMASGPDSKPAPSFAKPWNDWFALTVQPAIQKIAQPQTGTHAQRLTHPARINSSALLVPNGSIFYESDRKVFYYALNGAWIYLAGTMFAAAASRPADLGANDAGFQFWATDTTTFSLWTGSAWVNP